ncbi:RECEPTOR KINASE-LIKE PROTEIN XA21 [Salix viminalis]|uniref:RECEPTOR KINASE-LIKE PROTEIN XA21 n=1 Tax=Salix viminalis TaxID=40686 RepID=A0A9Q0ZQA3_SALVM|nr:RECEPTOR KINASE-LIKE PROTEIN XA21 [Salix viminalis]
MSNQANLLDSEFNDFGLAKMLIKPEELATVSCCRSFSHIAPGKVCSKSWNEKTDIYSFGDILLELATGKAATYGAKWALLHMQEGKPIVDSLDEEISNVFKLGVFRTSILPSARPDMKEVLQVLLGRSRPLVYGVRIIASVYDSTSLFKNSKRKM